MPRRKLGTWPASRAVRCSDAPQKVDTFDDRVLSPTRGCDQLCDPPVRWRRLGVADVGPEWMKTRTAAHAQ